MSGPKPTHAYVVSQRQKRKKDLEEFASDLQKTINKALPLVSISYRRVAVLAISWSNDTMGVKTTERELLDVFQNSYGFAVESHVIKANSTKGQILLTTGARISKFIADWDSEDSLTIYMYSGHGALERGGIGLQYLIAGQANQNGLVEPSFDWMNMSYTINSQSAELAMGDGPEILAAANYSSMAGAQLNTSFTRIVTAQLRELDGIPCSVSHLFGKIHRGVLEINIAQDPIHVPHPNKDSIILQRLERPGQTRQSNRMKDLQIGALQNSESRVLITVRLQDGSSVPNLKGWKQWLGQNIPPSVDPSQISIEGQFDIGSSLILVAMPLAIWTALPADDTAYSFVSFVTSGNRLLQQVGPLAYRDSRPTGSENQPPSFWRTPVELWRI